MILKKVTSFIGMTVNFATNVPGTPIKGGLGVGIDTCWFNRDMKPSPEGLAPSKYQVSSLAEVKKLVLRK